MTDHHIKGSGVAVPCTGPNCRCCAGISEFAETFALDLVCAWHPGGPVLVRSGAVLEGPLQEPRRQSHGICADCAKRSLHAYRQYRAANLTVPERAPTIPTEDGREHPMRGRMDDDPDGDFLGGYGR